MNEALFEDVKNLIAEQKKISADKISIDSKFDDLGFDSLDALLLLHELEDKFNLEVPNEDAERIQTVRDAVEILEKLGASA